MTKTEYIKLIKKARLANKNSWVNGTEEVNGAQVKIKFFQTWIQKMEVNGKNYSTPMECSVKRFNDEIDRALSTIEGA